MPTEKAIALNRISKTTKKNCTRDFYLIWTSNTCVFE